MKRPFGPARNETWMILHDNLNYATIEAACHAKENLMNILFIVHSLLRWVIIVVALLAIVKFALGLITSASFKGMDRGLAAGYSGLMDLQMTIGLIYFIWDGAVNTGFPTYRILHMVIMIAAAVESYDI